MEDIWDKSAMLSWSEKKYMLRHFLEVFKLPQVVKITHSAGSKKEARDNPIQDGEVLVLHKLVSVKTVVASNGKHKYYIPLDCPIQIDVKPSNYKDYYESVQELVKICPNFVRVLTGYLNIDEGESLEPGQKLALREVDNTKKLIKCVDIETEKVLHCPFFWNSQFSPLVDIKDYTLLEAIRTFSLPCNVEFIEGSAGKYHDSRVAILLVGLKTLTLKDVYTETYAIATSKQGQEKKVYALPQQTNVCVLPAKGAMANHYSYENLISSLDQAIKLREIVHKVVYDVKTPSIKCFSLTSDLCVTKAPFNSETAEDSYSGLYESVSESGISVFKPEVNYPEVKKPEAIYQDLLSLENNYRGSVVVKEDAPPPRYESSTPSFSQRCHSETRPTLPPRQITLVSIPDDLSGLTVDQMCECLGKCGMGSSVEYFRDELIDGEMFMSLTEETLKDLNLRPMQIHKVIKIINGWRPNISSVEISNLAKCKEIGNEN